MIAPQMPCPHCGGSGKVAMRATLKTLLEIVADGKGRVEQIVADARNPYPSSTTQNCLRKLVAAGLLRRQRIDTKTWTYSVAAETSGDRSQCAECGMVLASALEFHPIEYCHRFKAGETREQILLKEAAQTEKKPWQSR